MLQTFPGLFYPAHLQELQNNFKSDLSQVQNIFESSSLMARFKVIPGPQGIVQVNFEYFQGYFYNLFLSASAHSQERISPCPFTVFLWEECDLIFINPFQIAEGGLSKPSLLRPFLFAVSSGPLTVVVTFCCLMLSCTGEPNTAFLGLWEGHSAKYLRECYQLLSACCLCSY